MNVTRAGGRPSEAEEEDAMTYQLVIGDRSYSSWSLQGWLAFEKFGLPVSCLGGRLYTEGFERLPRDFAPARLVPAMRTPEGAVVWDPLAITETLAGRHPGAGHWLEGAAARAMGEAEHRIQPS